MAHIVEIPLPKRWPEHIKSAVLHTISLASMAFTSVSGWAARRADKLVRLQAELNGTKSEIALLREELSIKDARFGRVHSHRRPYYRPIERMRILKLKAARGWSTRQAATACVLNEHRPHEWLEGKTPREVYLEQSPRNANQAILVVKFMREIYFMNGLIGRLLFPYHWETFYAVKALVPR